MAKAYDRRRRLYVDSDRSPLPDDGEKGSGITLTAVLLNGEEGVAALDELTADSALRWFRELGRFGQELAFLSILGHQHHPDTLK